MIAHKKKKLAIDRVLRFHTPMTSPTPTLFRLFLGVSPKRGGRARGLWSTRVAPLGSEEKAPQFQADPKLLDQVFGSPCALAIETQVPRDHITGMSAAIHLAMALRLRAEGNLIGAEAIEKSWDARRRASSSLR
jgi:hypothetical protein